MHHGLSTADFKGKVRSNKSIKDQPPVIPLFFFSYPAFSLKTGYVKELLKKYSDILRMRERERALLCVVMHHEYLTELVEVQNGCTGACVQ